MNKTEVCRLKLIQNPNTSFTYFILSEEDLVKHFLFLDLMNSTMSPGSQGTRSRMASRLTGNKTSSGWSDYHSSFMRLSADRCVDRVRLMAAVLSITDIDAFHKVGQVSKGLFILKNNHHYWISIFLQAVF